MVVWKGGRGAKAPYETTHVRIPVDIKEQVQKLSDAYKNGETVKEHQFMTVDQAIEKARKILTSKKSAKISMQSLLTSIYGEDISL